MMDVLFRILQGGVAAALIIFFTLLVAEAGYGGVQAAAALMALGVGVYWLLYLLGQRDDDEDVKLAGTPFIYRYISRTTALVVVAAYIIFILGGPF